MANELVVNVNLLEADAVVEFIESVEAIADGIDAGHIAYVSDALDLLRTALDAFGKDSPDGDDGSCSPCG